MQRLPSATVRRDSSPEDCAHDLLAAVPGIMRFIRHEMRQHRHVELTIPQFRGLVFLNINDQASLSAMAEHLGLSLPATSRMVQILVNRGLMRRRTRDSDRRHVSLSLTGQGRSVCKTAHLATRVALAGRLRTLPDRDIVRVAAAMRVVGRLFAADGEQSKPTGR